METKHNFEEINEFSFTNDTTKKLKGKVISDAIFISNPTNISIKIKFSLSQACLLLTSWTCPCAFHGNRIEYCFCLYDFSVENLG